MNIRGLLLLLLVILPAAALLAFGPRGNVAAPPDRLVLQYWEKWTGVEGAAMQKIVDRFNEAVGAEHNIWVDYNAMGDVDKRMLIATAGGDPPDVAGLADRFITQYSDQDALLPLDDLTHEYGIDLDAFKPVWLKLCRSDGTLYALPSTPFTVALYYNRELFRQAGLDPDHPPQTTAELNEYALKLTRRAPDEKGRDKIVQLGFTVSPRMLGWWHWLWPYFFDGQFWDGEQFTLDTPATHAAMNWIKQRRDALGNKDVLQFEATATIIESAQNPFLAGNLAMVFQGPWMSNWARVYTPDLDYGVAPFPSVTRERQNVFASCDVFVIPRGARHPREAMIFLQYVMQQDVLEALCMEHGKVSPFRTPGENFFRDHPNPHIRVFDEMASSPYAFGFPQMPSWVQASDELLHMLDNVLRGAADPDEAIRATQEKVSAAVKTYEEMSAKRHGG